MTLTRISKTIHDWLGWCPNHPAAQAARLKIGTGIILVAVIGLLLMTTVALMIPAHAPKNVAVWAFRLDDSGVKHFVGRLPATEDTTGRLTFSPAGATTTALQPGKYSLIVEHPGSDGGFMLTLDGVNVKRSSPDSANGGTMLFKIGGPGSLQQEDAYQALLAAFDQENPDGTSIPAGISGYITERGYNVGN